MDLRHTFRNTLRLAFVASLVLLLWNCETKHEKPYVVMLSMDGFRWDYAKLAETPNLDILATKGVKAQALKPSFPTKTFPNHYTMVTGLYPDHHGIVLNGFYDPELGKRYSTRERGTVEDGSWYGGEPLWITAEKQDVISASFFWVGSEANVQNMYPSYWKKYDHGFPYGQRIDTVVKWLNLPEEERPGLVLWYFDEPDGMGHYAGPGTPRLINTIERLDSLLGVFLNKVDQLPHKDNINIIVTSDHGMGTISDDRVSYIEDHTDTSYYDVIEGDNPIFTFRAKAEKYEEAWKSLSSMPHVSCWKHGHLPERLHYGNNPRTLDFVVVADSGWSVGWKNTRYTYSGGAHGYDNNNTDMHAIFYAMGPAFKSGYVHPTFENVNIYPLICKILNLDPAENDGDLIYVEEMLK